MTQDKDIMVDCQGLSKVYSELTALDNLNLQVRKGEIFGYIGHNGAGKTTTIRILAGMMTASSGKATIAGVDVSSGRNKIKSVVGYMPDRFGVYEQMRVWEYLDFFGAAYRIPRRERKKRIDYVLDISGAEYMRDRFVDTLSFGMKQRIGIARTLIHDPEVMLLDEPANGLDPKARIQMRQLLRRLADSGKTLIVSSHILPELAAICDCVGIIDHGVLKISGPIQKVLGELSRDRLMEIKLLSDVNEAANLLMQDGICRNLDTEDAEMGLVRFRFNGDDEQLSEMLSKLHNSGAKVVTFREVPLSLEDAYMAISGLGGDDEEQDEEAADATNVNPEQESKE